MSVSVENCFKDAEESGVLQINHKGLKVFPLCVETYDLVDVLTVDISQNRFLELPQEILSFVMVERMYCKSNFLKSLPDLSHLNALSYLNVSQNLLPTLPVHLCSLPLKILNASHNKITMIPSEIGLLSKLQSLDLSNNELTNLPSTLGDLSLLRALNIRRNNIVSLPDELSKLKHLCEFDFSCNRVSVIPPAFRLISSLIKLELSNNPLTSPPAQICLKGRHHIVKYLSLAAQQQEKRWTMSKEPNTNRSPTPTSNSGEMFLPLEQQVLQVSQQIERSSFEHSRQNTLTNENEEDEIENEIADDPTVPSQVKDTEITNMVLIPEQDISFGTTNQQSVSAGKEKPVLPRKPNSFILSSKEKQEKQNILQERGKLDPQSYQGSTATPGDDTMRRFSDTGQQEIRHAAALDRSSLRNFENSSKISDQQASVDQRIDEEKLDTVAARKEQLLKNKEEILKSKHRLELIKSKSILRFEQAPEKIEIVSPTSVSSQTSNDSSQSHDSVFDVISKRNHLKPRNTKKLRDGASNYTVRRLIDSAKEEFEELEKLREAMESRLRIKLPDDLPASLSDGIVLCHLVNHLRKGTIAIIHVPSSGVPKLTMPKCQMNVDAFLDACRRLGVAKVDMCTPPDILEEKSPAKLCRCVQALLLALGVAPPHIVMANPLTPR